MNFCKLSLISFLFLAIVCIYGSSLLILPVYGHASPVTLNPQSNQVFTSIQLLPDNVTITFTESPEPRASSLKVVDSSGQRIDKNDMKASDPDKSLSISLDKSKMSQGAYTVDWMVLSKADGHFTRGTYVFTLDPTQNQSQNQSQSAGTNTSSRYSKNVTIGETLLQFDIVPFNVGQNTFNLYASFANGTAMGSINNVYLEFNNPEKNIGPIAATMDRIGQGNYTSTGSFLSQEGKWNIKLIIQRVGEYDINQQFDLVVK
ncbi:MAG: copper resistance protein CopC [Thermoproteota archaeon]|nr:copper resistance protein CopC [Thermoproteota archaeon]